MKKLKLTELNSGYEVVKAEKPTAQKKAVMIVAAALVVAFVVTFIASMVGVLPAEALFARIFGGTKGFCIGIETDSVINIKSMGEGVIVLTDKDVVFYGSDGNEKYQALHSFIKPAMSVNGDRAVVFDRGGTGFMLLNEKKQVLSGDAEGVVIAADYLKNGIYALSTRGETSTGTLTVYNRQSDVIFKWNCAYESITSVSLCENGKLAAVALFGVKNGDCYTTVKIFGFDYNEALSSATVNGASPLGVTFPSSSGALLFTDIGVFGIEKNATELSVLEEYYSPEFNSFGTASSGYSLLAIADHSSTDSFTVKLFGKNGSLKTELSVKKELKSVSLSNKYIFALAENEILVYNFKGKNVGTVNISGKLYSIYPNDKYIYIYSLDKITKAYSYGDSTVSLG